MIWHYPQLSFEVIMYTSQCNKGSTVRTVYETLTKKGQPIKTIWFRYWNGREAAETNAKGSSCKLCEFVKGSSIHVRNHRLGSLKNCEKIRSSSIHFKGIITIKICPYWSHQTNKWHNDHISFNRYTSY